MMNICSIPFTFYTVCVKRIHRLVNFVDVYSDLHYATADHMTLSWEMYFFLKQQANCTFYGKQMNTIVLESS